MSPPELMRPSALSSINPVPEWREELIRLRHQALINDYVPPIRQTFFEENRLPILETVFLAPTTHFVAHANKELFAWPDAVRGPYGARSPKHVREETIRSSCRP